MDITLDEFQLDIAKEARRFLEKEAPMEYVREMFEDDRGFTDALWNKINAMDWMKIRIPESYGGMEMDQLELAIILEEMGRVLLPGPFSQTYNWPLKPSLRREANLRKKAISPELAKVNYGARWRCMNRTGERIRATFKWRPARMEMDSC